MGNARQQRTRQQAHAEIAAQPTPPADADRRLLAESFERERHHGVGRGALVFDLARNGLERGRRRARFDHQHVDAGAAQFRPERFAEERDERLAELEAIDTTGWTAGKKAGLTKKKNQLRPKKTKKKIEFEAKMGMMNKNEKYVLRYEIENIN